MISYVIVWKFFHSLKKKPTGYGRDEKKELMNLQAIEVNIFYCMSHYSKNVLFFM